MEKLEYQISINASKQKVWDTMLQPATYREWVAVSWTNSFYEGKWKQNEKIKFISKEGSGTLAVIETLKPYQYILAKHIVLLNEGGIEDAESDFAKNWIGTTESYTFAEKKDQTELTINIQTQPEWVKMFNDGWHGALKQLKAICEQ